MIYFQPNNATSSDELLFPTETIPVRLDIQTIDHTEIGGVFGDLGQSFEIQANEATNKYFKFAMDASGQEIPGVYQPIEGSLNSESETLIKSCNLVVSEWDEITGTYTASIESSIIPLNDVFDGLKVSGEGIYDDYNDNPWQPLDHTYSMANIKGTWTQTSYGDYYYPFADYGFDEEGRPRIPDGATVHVSGYSNNPDFTNVVNNDYASFQQLYGDYLIGGAYVSATAFAQQNTQSPSPSLLTATPYFGEISNNSGEGNTQGFISSPSTPLRSDQLKPAVKLTKLIDVAFAMASANTDREITYDISTWSDDLNNCYILPNELGGLGIEGSGFTSNDGADVSQSAVTDQKILQSETAKGHSFFRDAIMLGEFGTLTNNNSNYKNWVSNPSSSIDGDHWVIDRDGSYKFVFKGTTEFEASGSWTKDRHRANFQHAILIDNDAVTKGQTIEIRDHNQDETHSFELTWEGTLHKGQTVTAGLFNTYVKATAGGNRDVDGTTSGWEFYTESAPLEWSEQECKVGEQFGDITWDELLEGILSKFNFVIVDDKTKKDHYKIIQYYDWILDGERRDWSDKVSNIRFSNIFTDQSKEIDFRDGEDDDRFSQERSDGSVFGQSTYVSDSENSSGNDTIGDFFGPLANANPTSDYRSDSSIEQIQRAYEVTLNQDGIPHLYEFDDNEKNTVKTKPRIGFRKNVSVSPFYYTDGNNPPSLWQQQVPTLSSTGWPGQGDINYSQDYGFNNIEGAYEKYWKPYIDHLYHKGARKMTADVFFEPNELGTKFNINDTIHIQGTDYLISKINGFNLSEPDVVSVEFITYQNNFTTVFTDWDPRYIEDTTDIRTHHVGINFTALDDDDNEIPATVIQDEHFISVTGSRAVAADGDDAANDADEFVRRVRWTPQDGYDLSASNFSGPETLPAGITLGSFTDDGEDVYVDITITIQNADTLTDLQIEAEVDPIPTGTFSTEVTFVLDSDVTDVSIANSTFTVRGTPNSIVPIAVRLSPAAGKQLHSQYFTGTEPENVDLIDFANVGTSVTGDFYITISDSDETKEVTIGQNNSEYITDLPDSVDVCELTVDFNESITNVSVAPSESFKITGIQGTTFPLEVNAYPAPGHTVSADNFSITETSDTSNVYSFIDAAGEHTAVSLIGQLTFPSQSTASVTLAVNGSAQEIDAEIQTVTVTFDTLDSNDNSTLVNASISDTSSSETFTGSYDTELTYVLGIYPDSNYQITTAPTVTSSDTDVLEVVSVTGGGGYGNQWFANCKVKFGSTATDSATLSISASAVTLATPSDGSDGTSILNGTGNPTATDGEVGDFWLNTTTQYIWGPKTSDGWPASGVDLNGSDGTNGNTILNGSGGPSSSDGEDGDFWLDTTNDALYGPKSSGVWPATGVSLIGASGSDGNTILYGTSDPTASQGNDGDFFLRTDNDTLFGPKSGGAWPSGTSLIGQDGTDGNTVLSGSGNPTSSDGVNGDFWINLTTYHLFGPKASGSWPATGQALRGADGATGPAGMRNVFVSIYNNATATPTTPGAGSYNFSTDVLSAPSGWTANPTSPDTGESTYVAYANVDETGTNPVSIPSADWSTVVKLTGDKGDTGGAGASGTSTVTNIIWRRSATAPSTPTGGAWDFDNNEFVTTVAGGAATALTSGWSDSPPTGTQPLYQSQEVFASNSGGIIDSTGWSTPVLFVKDGTNGSDGDDGQSTFTPIVYQFSEDEPDKPTGATYNWSTGVIGSLNNGWSQGVPTNDGTTLWQTQGYVEVVNPGSSAHSISNDSWSDPGKNSVANGYIYRITVNSTDLFNAKVSKSVFDFPFTDSDLGTTKTLSSGNTFTVDAADTAVQYTADTKPTNSSSSDSSLGTITIGDPNDDGECTVTIGGYTLPTASELDNSGIYEAELILLGAATELSNATTASFTDGAALTIPANGRSHVLDVQSDGRWTAYKSSTNGYSSLVKGWNEDPNGRIVISFEENTGSNSRTSTFRLYPGTTIVGQTALTSITVTQSAAYSAESDDVAVLKLVTSIPASDDDDYNAQTLYLKYEV